MKERLVKLKESVDRMTLRERLFLFAAAITVMSGAWEALLAAPLGAREKLASAKIAQLQQRIQTLNDAMTTTAEGIGEGMPSQLDRLHALQGRVAEGEQTVRIFTSDLVDPREMRVVLEDLLRRQTGLKLLSATNLEPRPLFEDPAKESDAAPGAAGTRDAPQPVTGAPKLYRHTLVLKLEGSYLDCLEYLQAVERLPWHLYWGRLELRSDEYPKNEIVIEVRTLSLDKEWIGV
jgi:MSHA biogenesis protein MshJ